MRRLLALARGLGSDPAVCVTLGVLLLARGMEALAQQAQAVGAQVAQVQAQARFASAIQAEANGFRPEPDPRPDGAVFHEAPDPAPAPEVS